MKWVWLGLAALVVAGAVIGGIKHYRDRDVVPVTMATVTHGTFTREVSGNGSVEARVYTLTFARAGRIGRVLVKEGEHVSAGAALAELSTSREQDDLLAARERLIALDGAKRAAEEDSQAALQKLDVQLAEQRDKLTLTRKLFTAGAASRDEVESLTHQVATLTADRAAQQAGHHSRQQDNAAQLANLKAEIQGLERILRESRLLAPVAGTISSIDFRIGEAAQGAVKLVEDGTLRVRVRLAEADTVGLHVGQSARVEPDADPEHPLQATVTRLGVVAEIEGQGGSAVLPVTLTFRDPQAAARVRHGYTVTGRITTLSLPAVELVPLEALLTETGALSHDLWVIDPKTHTVSRKPVVIQARNLTQAVVQGVSAGTQIVSLPPKGLKDGTRVRVNAGEAEKK